MPHPYGCCVLACSAVFGVFLTVLGALPPRMRIGDCMKCECECHCGGIPSRDALNDRLHWVYARGFGRCAAWRGTGNHEFPWVISDGHPARLPFYKDEDIRIIHEIIPE